jgi:RNA polymerase sigma-32 factor
MSLGKNCCKLIEIGSTEMRTKMDDAHKSRSDPEVEVLPASEVVARANDASLPDAVRTPSVFRGSAPDLPVSADPLTAYLAQLRRVEPLPAEEQQKLAIRYIDEEDVEAAKMLILTNMRLVVKIAREYQRRWTNLLDLIQEGNVGLAEAVTRYDPYRGVKFTSYAQYWIRAMILNYLMNHLHPVKIGSSRAGRKLFYNLKKARNELVRQGHENPSPKLIADYLDVDEDEVVRVTAQLDRAPVSLDAQAPGHEKTTLGELMADASSEDPEEVVGRAQVRNKLAAAIAGFGKLLKEDRDRAIWSRRMIAEDAESLVELGREFGVSKERIRQIEVQIRQKFRKFLVRELGEDIEINFSEL